MKGGDEKQMNQRAAVAAAWATAGWIDRGYSTQCTSPKHCTKHVDFGTTKLQAVSSLLKGFEEDYEECNATTNPFFLL